MKNQCLRPFRNFWFIKTKPAKTPGGRAVCEYQVNAFKDILNVIIPFFNANPLLTTKNLNYQDFVTVKDLVAVMRFVARKSGKNTLLKKD